MSADRPSQLVERPPHLNGNGLRGREVDVESKALATGLRDSLTPDAPNAAGRRYGELLDALLALWSRKHVPAGANHR